MKKALTIIACIAAFNLSAQTKKPAPKPAPPTEAQKVRSKVIAETKGRLELPKYFRLEKVTVEQVVKGQYINVDIGIEMRHPEDSLNACKYFILSDFSMCDFVTEKAYKIDSIQLIHDSYFVYSNGETLPCMFSNNSQNIRFYKSYKKEKKWINSFYDTKIIYWAMSNGGVVRLYTDYGVVKVEKSGAIVYEAIED